MHVRTARRRITHRSVHNVQAHELQVEIVSGHSATRRTIGLGLVIARLSTTRVTIAGVSHSPDLSSLLDADFWPSFWQWCVCNQEISSRLCIKCSLAYAN